MPDTGARGTPLDARLKPGVAGLGARKPGVAGLGARKPGVAGLGAR